MIHRHPSANSCIQIDSPGFGESGKIQTFAECSPIPFDQRSSDLEKAWVYTLVESFTRNLQKQKVISEPASNLVTAIASS